MERAELIRHIDDGANHYVYRLHAAIVWQLLFYRLQR